MTVVTTVLHPENDPSVDLHPETDAGQVTDFLNKTYPIDSIYISVGSTSPASIFGGTWTKIQNGFLLSAGYDSISNGVTGGSKTALLDLKNMPREVVRRIRNLTGYSVTFDHAEKVNTIVADNGLAYTFIGNANYWDTDASAGDTSFSIMPPYIAVNMWKRVA